MSKIAIMAAAAMAFAGCNTVAGVGKDVSAVGHVMTKTASDAGRARPIRTACVQDSRVPPRSCPPAARAKTTTAAKSTSATQTAQATTTKQPAGATTATPVKTSTKAKSGWWQ